MFDLDVAPMTTLDPSQYHRHITRIAPVAHSHLYTDAVSQPYVLAHSTRISALTSDGVIGLNIPHSNNTIESVSLVDRRSLRNHYACIGYDRAIICSGSKVTILKYAWPEDHPSVAEKDIDWTTSDGLNNHCWSNALFDESSGRILLSAHKTGEELLLGIGSL